jgi:hypothetical protein
MGFGYSRAFLLPAAQHTIRAEFGVLTESCRRVFYRKGME